ncbi:MAG: rod shape-determining protein RodA [Verrucomicrobiota bacterium]|nr:rod shape-determining protein RodA [Verrucomicrobiota bacterium]
MALTVPNQQLSPATWRETFYRFLSGTEEAGVDWVNPICILALSVIGVFFIYSAHASVGGDFWVRQIVFLGTGVVLYSLCAYFNYRVLFVNAHWFYLLCLLPLPLVFFPPFGETRSGASRWLDFGVVTIQPAEIAKIGTLIMMASILARGELSTVGKSLGVLFLTFVVTIVPFLLIFLQPDLGSALILPLMVFSLLYVSKLSLRFFLALLMVFILAVTVVGMDIYGYKNYLIRNDISAQDARGKYEVISWFPLKDYQRERILDFVSPDSVDPQGIGIGWNRRQSLQAVGTGGLTGKGWTEGTQAKLGYLPRSVAHNDFIFSVLSEESGFLGGLTVIGLFAVIAMNNLRIAGLSRDRFGMLVVVGAAVVLMVHVFVNIGMSLGLMPIKGLPLPFLSYGGSFILSSFILLGLVQSVYRHRRSAT